MQNKQTIISEIELSHTLREITQSYQEISVLQMQKNRASVLKTRDFLEHLGQVYFNVKQSYKGYVAALEKKHKKIVSQKIKKSASVLLSANTKLYGDIVSKVFHFFVDNVDKNSSDVFIVGALGKELFDELENKRTYTYFEVPDSQPTVEDLKPLIYALLNYDTINVFYGKFETIISQSAVVTNVSGDEPVNTKEIMSYVKESGEPERNFLFEPSLEIILHFFETQLFSTFLKQTIHESQLSRFASRIKAMENALSHIDGNLKNLYSDKRRVNQQLYNKKQNNSLAGMSLWQ